MNAPPFDCVCAGILVADHVCEPITRMPVPGELVLSPRMDLTTGGNAANVAIDLVRLGRSVEIAGVVGRDVFGDFVREVLTEAGVSCGHLKHSQTQATSGTFVINSQSEDRRFIHTIGANAEFTGQELTEELIVAGRILYVGGFCLCQELTPDAVARAFQIARDAGVTTVLDVVLANDPQNAWHRLQPVLPFTDVFLPNSDEAQALTGLTDPIAQAKQFREAGAKTVVVTCGEKGSVLLGDREQLRADAFPVEYLDGTGSGDAFSAGFIHGLLEEADMKTCLRWGSAMGASCVRSAGASTGVFTSEELKSFCDAHRLGIESIAP